MPPVGPVGKAGWDLLPQTVDHDHAPRSDLPVANDALTPPVAQAAVLTARSGAPTGRHAGAPLVAGRYRLQRVLGRGAGEGCGSPRTRCSTARSRSSSAGSP